MKLTQEEVAAVRDVVARRCGFFLGAPHERYLGCRVSERIRELGSEFPDYLDRLASSPLGGGELQVLVERLCIYETRFMRDAVDLRATACCALPILVRDARRSRRHSLRVVSAGCSTGQEVYSLAMILHEAAPERKGLDFEVLGLDISGDALNRARRAVYSEREMMSLDPWRRERYFVKTDEGYVVVPWLRERTQFLSCNIAEMIPVAHADIIFCRNVLIYFDTEQRQEVIRSLLASLRLGGFLVVGAADSTREYRNVLQVLRVSGTILYRRVKAMEVSRGGTGLRKAGSAASLLAPGPSSGVRGAVE